MEPNGFEALPDKKSSYLDNIWDSETLPDWRRGGEDSTNVRGSER